MQIAIIDATAPDAPARFTQALIDTGFTVLAQHPIDPVVLAEVRRVWLDFFASDDKDSYIPPDGAQDGFHPLSKSETAVGAPVRDLKEFFHWYPWGRGPASVAESTRQLFDAAAGFDSTRPCPSYSTMLVARCFGWRTTRHCPSSSRVEQCVPLPTRT